MLIILHMFRFVSASGFRLKLKVASACLCLVAPLAGCDAPVVPGPPVEPMREALEPAAAPPPSAPASFLDEPPAPPESDTFILSGGTLIDGEDQFDAVVVVQSKRVIAAGKRGQVPVPPDSIGIDTSGKFITANDPNLTLIGGPADLTVYNKHPEKAEDASIYARVTNGRYELSEPADR